MLRLAAIAVSLLSALLSGEDRLRCILVLTGASDAEQLDESVLERYEALALRPVRLNGASRSRLSALLTPYQIASLEDYRSRFGDVLSVAELALVDGFGTETAMALAPFVSFASSTLPGVPAADGAPRHSALLKGGLSAGRTAWGAKYRFSSGERFAAALAARKSFTEPPAGTFYLQYEGMDGKVVLGDFNARFGQGVALWSGFFLETPSSPEAFARRPGGIVPTWSCSGALTHRGLAGDLRLGPFLLSGFVSAPGLKERMERGKGTVKADMGANLLYAALKGQASLTCYHAWDGPSRLALDGRRMFGRFDCFGEAAFDLRRRAPAACGGFLLPTGEHFRFATRLRALPTAYSGKKAGEYAAALALEYRDGRYVDRTGRTGFGASVLRNQLTCTLEAALLPVPALEIRRQLRGLLRWEAQPAPSWHLDLRLTERLRSFAPENRTDFRADAEWSDGLRSIKTRVNLVRSRSWGALSYAEYGRQEETWFCWARGTLFHADHWDDRIYCYERDAPGTFNIPAYYGRGWALSAYGGYKLHWLDGRWKLYLRASYVFTAEKKPGKAGLNLQVAADF